ncbi:hypothetical protein [Reinekea blandensis]|nr:hypothetical protein [Reinekea blandensis]
MPTLMTPTELSASLAVPDLTDPGVVPDHALQMLIKLVRRALSSHWNSHIQTLRTPPMVPVENNYDRLNYPADGAARDARYTRYVTDRYLLRTQTSSAVPDALAGQHGHPPPDWLLMLPGMVYRRDSIDRLHCAEPHQLDLWRVVDHRIQRPLTTDDLQGMVQIIMSALVPGREWRLLPSPHPYTLNGMQIDVYWQDQWIEVGECGIGHPSLLKAAYLNHHSSLAMGLGLDRLLMIRKDLPDIRLLRHPDYRIQEQMQDLSRYRPVSNQPSVQRDLSLVVDMNADEETLGDLIRRSCSDVHQIESLSVIDESPYEALPPKAIERLGISNGQKNVLLRLVLRNLNETLTAEQANAIRNRVYRTLHQGQVVSLAENREG